MELYYGVVRDNRVELDNGVHLAEGVRVEVRPRVSSPSQADREDGVLARLRAVGGLEHEAAHPRQSPAPFEPIIVEGEPLSEQIIRERR